MVVDTGHSFTFAKVASRQSGQLGVGFGRLGAFDVVILREAEKADRRAVRSPRIAALLRTAVAVRVPRFNALDPDELLWCLESWAS